MSTSAPDGETNSDSLRVLILVGSYPTISETFIVGQVRGLVERGHKVTVLSAGGSPDPIRIHEEAARDAGPLVLHAFRPGEGAAAVLQSLGFVAKQVARNRGAALEVLSPRIHGWHTGNAGMLCRLGPLLDQHLTQFDVVHAQFATLGRQFLPFIRTGSLTGALVTSMRGHDITAAVRRSGDGIYGDLFEAGDWFLPNCEHFRDRALALGAPPERTEILRSGIDVERFQVGSPRSRPANEPLRLLTVGRLVGKKGIGDAVEAVALLTKAGLPVRYRVAGEGPLRSEIERQVADLGVGDEVELVGKCEPAEVIAMLEESDIFLAPSVTALNGDQDGPPNTIKEAMACGVPVVATRHGGIPELIENERTGLLVDERDPEALAEAVRRLDGSPRLASDFTAAARRLVETEYDIAHLNDQLVCSYRKAIAARASGLSEGGRLPDVGRSR